MFQFRDHMAAPGINGDRSSLYCAFQWIDRSHFANNKGSSGNGKESTSTLMNGNDVDIDDDKDKKKKWNSSTSKSYWDYSQKHHFEFEKFSPIRRFFSVVSTVFFGYMCKAWMNMFHKITFINKEEFEELIWSHWVNVQRGKLDADFLCDGKKKIPGLLTVMNHASMMDEPFLVANLVPSKWLFTPEMLRSPICAIDQCFPNFMLAEMAKTLRILPIQRGGSIQQSAMDIVIEKLSKGYWVSIFPEGYIKQDGQIHQIRKGVGKLIAESDPTPKVYPIYHRGMEDVKREEKWLPSIDSHIVVKLGRKIKFDDIITQYRQGALSAEETYIIISNRIRIKLEELKKEVDEYRKQHNIRNKSEIE